MVHRNSRPSLWALIEIYRRLLGRIEASGFDVFSRRVRLSTIEKLTVVAEAFVRGPFL
jgi:phytoene synthase